MTTSTKDIEYLVNEHCSSIHFTELDKLLKKLDHEDLDVLRAMLEEVYAVGVTDLDNDRNMWYRSGYDNGYSDGYSDGWEEGYSDGCNR